MLSSDLIINLDKLPLSTVKCDNDMTRLLLVFPDATLAEWFVSSLRLDLSFVVASGKMNCSPAALNDGSFLLRRVLDYAWDDSSTVELSTAPARYEDVIESGQISIGPSKGAAACGAPLADAETDVCIGYNVDSQCHDAKQTIPIYSNPYVTVTCSDCFIALHTTIFASVKIQNWKLQSLSGGFKNIHLLGSLVFDMLAHGAWSVGVDKGYPIVKDQTILTFYIGPIPVRIWFEIPMEVKGDASFSASAEAVVGANADWDVGETYISWDPDHGWQAVGPHPVFHWQPVVKGAAQFRSDAAFEVIPSFILHLDKIFTSTTTIDPKLMFHAEGSATAGQLCADLKYDVGVRTGAVLEIDTPWLHVHGKYGPVDIYESGVQPIGRWCYP